MLKIRLRRVGAKKQPSFRIVIADARAARDGAFVEQVGHYDPKTDPPTIVLDRERADEWIGKGAQPTESVLRLFRTHETQQNSAAETSEPEPTKATKKSAKAKAKAKAEEPAAEAVAEEAAEATAEADEADDSAGEQEAAEEPAAEPAAEAEEAAAAGEQEAAGEPAKE